MGLKGKRAAVLLYSYYRSDPRPRREAESLRDAGMEVDVICLRASESLSYKEEIDGVHVTRVPLRRRRSGPITYVFQYLYFWIACFLLLSLRRLRKRYDIVHVHNMPDFLVFAAILPRILGAKVVLDLHDPMPELFNGIYGGSCSAVTLRLLRALEGWSIGFADLVLTPNNTFKEIFVARGSAPGKIQVVMNSPDEEFFHSRGCAVSPEVPSVDRPFKIMYHGLLVERHGLNLAIRAIAEIRGRIPGLQLHLFGERTEFLDRILDLAKELGLEDCIFFHGFKSLREIAEAISTIDLGLIPNRLNEFTRINLPTRIFEYLALHKPVLVPRTEGIRDYFSDDEILFFEGDSAEDLVRQIDWIYSHPAEVAVVVEHGRKVYEAHRWSLEKFHFLGLIENLLESPPSSCSPPLTSTGSRRVCMIAYSSYESDNRVIRYAESLARRGDSVEVLAVKSDPSKPRHEVIGGVNVSRIQCRSKKTQQTKAAYLLPLIQFWLLSTACLSWRHFKKRYDLVHIHNMPDFLVFAAWLPKWTGAKVVLDIHDVVPEFYASKFRLGPDSFGVRMLKCVERASARFADWVIISNHLWLDMFVTRTGVADKCSVFINNVDSTLFHPRPRVRSDDRLIVMFPGGLQWHQGLDIALRAFQKVSQELPNAEFHIYGDGIMKPSLLALSEELGFNGNVRFFEPLTVQGIAAVMADADLGVVPKRADSFGNEAYSTKIMEFMSLGVPVVISNTKIDRYYFNDSVVRFFESGNADALAREMIALLRDPGLRRELASRASEYAAENCWDRRKADYLHLVDSVCSGNQKSLAEELEEQKV
jgi:glycosyltransferase involved in cell wall biosynthesis